MRVLPPVLVSASTEDGGRTVLRYVGKYLPVDTPLLSQKAALVSLCKMNIPVIPSSIIIIIIIVSSSSSMDRDLGMYLR